MVDRKKRITNIVKLILCMVLSLIASLTVSFFITRELADPKYITETEDYVLALWLGVVPGIVSIPISTLLGYLVNRVSTKWFGEKKWWSILISFGLGAIVPIVFALFFILLAKIYLVSM